MLLPAEGTYSVRKVGVDLLTVGVAQTAQFSNPSAGTAVRYTQHNTTTDVFTVSGELWRV